jgi:hypothetical protein
MPAILDGFALAVAVVAALRSTWSPCGLSMLSSITPIGERGRRQRFRSTASWFVAGATMGGACLGGVCLVLARIVALLSPSPATEAALVATASMVCAASELGLGGFSLPIHRRQVNELWLDKYRGWVYGAGFGLQIGSGLATYITTGAIYLTILLSALTTLPLGPLVVGTVFGMIRGLTVLLGRRIQSPEALRQIHRRLAHLDSAAGRVVVGCEVVVGVSVLVWAHAPWAVTATAGALVSGALVYRGTFAKWTVARKSAS